MKKSIIIIIILIAIIIGESIYFGFSNKAKIEEAKKISAEGQDISKGLSNIFVQVRIKEDTKDGQYTDSIYYSSEEWEKATAESVKKAIEDRVNKWTSATSLPATN